MSRQPAGSTPHVVIAGYSINPRNHAPLFLPLLSRLAMVGPRDGTTRAVRVPRSGSLWPVGFSNDDKYFVFASIGKDRVRLHRVIGDSDVSEPVTERALNATAASIWTPPTAAGPLASWLGDTPRLVCRFVVHARVANTNTTRRLYEPLTYDTRDGEVATEWVEGALDTQAAITRFRTAFTSQIAILDVRTGESVDIGSPGLFGSIVPSPDGSHMLVERFDEPAKRGTWLSHLRRSVEVWKIPSTTHAAKDVRCATCEGGPGPASPWRWSPGKTASLIALILTPQGSCLKKWNAEFKQPPKILYAFDEKFDDFSWTTTGKVLLWRRASRRTPPLLAVATRLGAAFRPLRISTRLLGRTLARNPAGFLYRAEMWAESPLQTQRTIIENAGHISLVSGDRSTTLLRVDVPAGRTVVRCTRKGERIWRVQTVDERLQGLDGHRRAAFATRTQTLTYKDSFGDVLTATVCLPDTHEIPRRLPFLVWVYPQIIRGQTIHVRRNDRDRTRHMSLFRLTPLTMVSRGFGVVVQPPMPIRYEGRRTATDFVRQAVALGVALRRALVKSGLADPRRIVIGGHCLGAFVAALLLSRTSGFCAGVLSAGLFNQMLLPLGGIDVRATWRAPHAHQALSPILQVHKIDAPVLILHGTDDRVLPGVHSVDFTTQSRQFYSAVAAAGGTARYVAFPGEGHYCISESSVVRASEEMVQWCERYAAGSDRGGDRNV